MAADNMRLRVVLDLVERVVAPLKRISTGSTEKKAPPRLSRSCLARTMPSSTGSTASRCEGLAAR